MKTPVIFETERLIIHPYTESDLDNFYTLNGNEEIMRYIRPAQSLDQTKEFLQRIVNDYANWPGMGRWAMYIQQDKSYIGSFAIIPVENSDLFQLGYALVKEHWGKGYATESVKGGLKYAFGQLNLKKIAGITYAENISSQKVLLKNGFVFDRNFLEEGKTMNLYMCRR